MARRFRLLVADPARNAHDIIKGLRDGVIRPFEQYCTERDINVQYEPFTTETAPTLLHTPAVIVCIVGEEPQNGATELRDRMRRTLSALHPAEARTAHLEQFCCLFNAHAGHAEQILFFYRQRRGVAGKAGTALLEELSRKLDADRYVVYRSAADHKERHQQEIVKALIALVGEWFPDAARLDTAVLVRSRHAGFADHFRAGYKRDATAVDDLRRKFAASNAPIVITGEQGAGKTTLAVNGIDEILGPESTVPMIHHFVQADGDGTDHAPLLHHILSELKEKGLYRGTIRTSIDEMENALLTWANSPPERPVVMLLDGLERLRLPSRELRWLPRTWAPGIRLVLTLSSNDIADELREREWEVFPLATKKSQATRSDINRWKRGDMGRGARRRIETNEEDLEDLVGKALQGSKAAIDHILKGLSSHNARHLLRLLWAARRGLTMDEIQSLFRGRSTEQAAIARAARMIAGLRALIAQRGDVVTFTSHIARTRVRHYFTCGENERREICSRLAEHLMRHGTPVRRAEELPALLLYTKDHDALYTTLADLDFLAAMIDSGRASELYRLWHNLGGPDVMRPAYRNAITGMYAGSPMNPANLAYRTGVTERLAAFLSECGAYGDAATLLEQAERHCAVHDPNNRHSLARLKAARGEILRRAGRYEAAIKTLNEAIELLGAPDGDPHLLAQAGSDLALTLREASHPDALGHFRRALAAKLGTFGPDDPAIAETLNDMGLVYLDRGDYRAAVRLFQEALDIQRRHNPRYPATATYLNSLAGARQLQGRQAMALGLYMEAWLQRIHLLNARHHHTLLAQFNAAVAMHRRCRDAKSREDDGDEILAMARGAHTGLRDTLHEDHPDFLEVGASLGHMLREHGLHGEAEELLRATLGTCRLVFDLEHRIRAACTQNLASLLREQGRHREAAEHYGHAVAEWRALLPPESPRIAAALRAMAESVEAIGELWQALLLLKESYDLYCSAFGAGSPQVSRTAPLIVDCICRAVKTHGTDFVPDTAGHSVIFWFACFLDDHDTGGEEITAAICALLELYLAKRRGARDAEARAARDLYARLGCGKRRT